VFDQTQEEVHEVHKVRELTAVCLLSLPNEWDESRPHLKPDAWESILQCSIGQPHIRTGFGGQLDTAASWPSMRLRNAGWTAFPKTSRYLRRC
jgi:hypothetical protein